MLALIEDEIGAGDPGLGLRFSLAGHGLAERARGAGVVGPSTSRETDLRGGALLVLIAWAAFVVAGAGYSKAAEHFDAAVPFGAHPVPQVAYDVVFAFGVLGGILVFVGAAIALPGFLRLLRTGAWPAMRRHVARASALSVITAGLVIPLATWAHHLSDHQRNGGSVLYSAAFLAWAALAVASLMLWTAVAVAVGRRVELSPRALRVEAGLALVLAAAMVAVTAASVVWWIGMAVYAPSFVNGLSLTIAVAVMLVGLALSGVGVRRIVRA